MNSLIAIRLFTTGFCCKNIRSFICTLYFYLNGSNKHKVAYPEKSSNKAIPRDDIDDSDDQNENKREAK